MAEYAGQGPCGHPAATEGERVVEGATTERHPHRARGFGSLPTCAARRRTVVNCETLLAGPLCLLVRMRRSRQAPYLFCGKRADVKANHRGRGVMNAMDVVEKKMAAKAQKDRSHLVVRDQVVVVETDSMADLVLSQGRTTIANLVRYQSPVCVTARGTALQQPGSGPSCYGRFRQRRDKSRGAGRLPLRELSSWSDHADHTAAILGRLQGFLGAKTKAVILGVAHGGALPDVEDAESARWLKALSMESRLLRWIACSDFGLLHDRFIETKKPWPANSTFARWWQTTEDRVLLCAEEVAPASTSSHLSCHFDGFMVHRDVPRVTSSQHLDDLAPPNRRASLDCRGAGRPGRGSGTGPLCHCAGDHDGLVVGGGPCRKGGARSGARPHRAGLAGGRERRGPRERGRRAPGDRFRHPERCGQPSDPERHAPWGDVPVFWLLLQTVVVHSKKPVSHRSDATGRSASCGSKTEASPCPWMDAVGASR